MATTYDKLTTYRNGVHPARRCFTGFVKAVAEGDKDRLQTAYSTGYQSIQTGVAKAPMAEGSGVTGGYLVPTDFSTQLWKAIDENSILWPRATRVPMDSQRGYWPTIDTTTVQTSPTPAFFGGINLQWGFEQPPPETEPKFRAVELTAWDLLGFMVVSNQWLSDIGEAGEDALTAMLGKACAWFSEYAFFSGAGAAKQMPVGILNAPATVSVARSGGGAIAASDVANMAAKLLPFSWVNSIWCCSPSCMSKLATISQFIVNGDYGFRDGTPGHAGFLLSRPLFVTDKLPTCGKYGDIVLIDPSMYLIGDRQQVLIDVSNYDPSSWTNNQSTIRIWLRCDGKPQVDRSITLPSGDVVSPFVALAA